MYSQWSLNELAGTAPEFIPSDRLSGKTCLVTGATSGIGRAVALRMAREGARTVIISGRRQHLGEQLVGEIRRYGTECLFVTSDVAESDSADNLICQIMEKYGRLDTVFNNAGCQEERALLTAQSDVVYHSVFNTNVRGLFQAMRAQIPAILASGGGTIVNNASVSGMRNPNPGLSLYSASKAAAISLTRSAAMEYAREGIRINGIAPGRVVTDLMLASGIADMKQVAAGLPLKRMGHPEEVAAAVVWLLSDEASYVVGQVLAADGGFMAG